MGQSKVFSLIEYFEYMGGNSNSRRIYEGEEVFRAGHIIVCGKLRNVEQPDCISIYALCLQTSALQSSPHVIKGQLKIENNNAHVHKMECSCKGGSSGRCKHISAVLIQCSRTPLESLEELSQTDMQCAWSLTKQTSKEQYKPVPIPNMPCYKDKLAKPPVTISDNNKGEVLENLLRHAPNSGLNLNRMGRRKLSSTEAETEAVMQRYSSHVESILGKLLDNASQSVLMMELEGSIVDINDCCKSFIKEHFMGDIQQVEMLTKSSQKEWHQQRKFRITGSRIYEIYTYAGRDWTIKAEKYFNPKHFTNKYIQHGLNYENAAREQFANVLGQTVETFGLIVSCNNPWLAYSPDGVTFEDGNPVALIEIKCPFEGELIAYANMYLLEIIYILQVPQNP